MSTPTDSPRAMDGLVVSIVSHGHAQHVAGLLRQLADCCGASVSRVVLTLNIPEPDLLLAPPPGGWPFALQLVRNAAPLGFGANHNRALAGAPERFVCVLNPDVQLLPGEGDAMAALCRAAAGAGAGIAYPVQVDAAGVEQDSRRELTTPLSLLRRRLLRGKPRRCDWVNAACVVLPTAVWHAVAGFDERFFMYCEDVDLSLRVQLRGWRLVPAPVRIVHAGQCASSRQWLHFKWHVQSLWRLWRSPGYAQARRQLRQLGHIVP
ncbi:glycosyl transferase [Comamonas endophytica]|nr:glycosyl transferase [Acidovorax sp. 5MLIR]